MKNSILTTMTFLFCAFVFSNVSAQVDEMETLMSLGDQNAITLDVDNVDKKALQNYFKEYFKQFGKVKQNKKADEYYISDAKIKSISKQKMDVYAKVEELNKAARLYLWLDNGTEFINSGSTEREYEETKDVLMDFATHIEKSIIEDELKSAEKNLAGMERNLKQLEKDNEKYHKAIEDAQKKIADMEEAIEKNVQEQESKSEEIEIHKNGVEEIRSKLNNVGKSKKIKM